MNMTREVTYENLMQVIHQRPKHAEIERSSFRVIIMADNWPYVTSTAFLAIRTGLRSNPESVAHTAMDCVIKFDNKMQQSPGSLQFITFVNMTMFIVDLV